MIPAAVLSGVRPATAKCGGKIVNPKYQDEWVTFVSTVIAFRFESKAGGPGLPHLGELSPRSKRGALLSCPSLIHVFSMGGPRV